MQPFIFFFPEQENNDAILVVSTHSLYLSLRVKNVAAVKDNDLFC